MNFDFSTEQKQLRESLRRYLEAECTPNRVRAVLDGKHRYDSKVWQGLADLGCLSAAIPEADGGLGLGYLELCVIAQELGRALAPVPVSSSVYLFTEVLKAVGNDSQQTDKLSGVATGDLIGTVAHVDASVPSGAFKGVQWIDGCLSGAKTVVADAQIASYVIVTAREGTQPDAPTSLFLVEHDDACVSCDPVKSLDPSRPIATMLFEGAKAVRIGSVGQAGAILDDVFDRAAVLIAFEQVGGAERALELACDYARERFAFGLPIGSFQAVKQLVADMYVSLELARANAHYAAWALSVGASDFRCAAATARVSATRAFNHCVADNIQVHGGVGFTWEVDAHLFYRRAHHLALLLGGVSRWEAKLFKEMRTLNQQSQDNDGSLRVA